MQGTSRPRQTISDYTNDGSPQSQAGGGDALGSMQSQISQLFELIESLIKTHAHNGNQSPRVNMDTDIAGLFETVSTAPSTSTNVPQSMYDQVKIYKNGTTYRLYWYDATNKEWRYATGT